MTKISVMGVPTGSFVSKWRIVNDGESIALPLVSNGIYDFIVNWGDGTRSHITTWDQVDSTHTYAKSGVKTISITGTIEGWSFGTQG